MYNLLTTSSVLLLLTGCTQEKNLVQVNNQAPTIELISHLGNVANVIQGNPEVFIASVSDNNEPAANLQVIWRTPERVICDWTLADEDGLSECTITPDTLDEQLLVIVKDSRDAKSSVTMDLIVTLDSPPNLEVETPVQNWNYYTSHPVPLQLQISDDTDLAEDLFIQIESSIDGFLPENWSLQSDGTVYGNLYLSGGEHILDFVLTDTHGNQISEERTILVQGENTPPDCGITSPTESFISTAPVELYGQGSDIDVDSIYLNAEWSSDLDGVLYDNSVRPDGTTTLNSVLNPGIHQITLTVTDEVNTACQAVQEVFVNSAPILSVPSFVSPNEATLAPLNEDIEIAYTVTDATDPTDNLTVYAYSDLDGEISESTPDSNGNGQIILSNLSAGIHQISVIAHDPHGATSSQFQSFQINTLPYITTPLLSNAWTNVDLEFIGNALDPDGDNVTVQYEWFNNGQLTAHTSDRIPGNLMVQGDVWTVNAVPNDGYTDGVLVTATTIVQNAPPQINTHQIVPSTIYNDSTVTCLSSGFDPDESITLETEWIINGTVYPGSSIDLSTVTLWPNDEILCHVFTSDSAGNYTESAEIQTIQNRTPIVQSHAISPSPLYSIHTPTCNIDIIDPDGEEITTTVEWFNNGVLTTDATTELYSTIQIGDSLDCAITVVDPHGASATSTTNAVVVNSPPIIHDLTLTPNPPNLTAPILCSVDFSDPEGHSSTLSIDFQNVQTGATVAGSIVANTNATADLSTLGLTANDQVACIATVTDSFGDSSTQQIITQLADTPPTITQAISIDATTAEVGDVVTCSMTVNDLEDGPLTPQYTWTSAGVVYGSGNTFVVTSDVPVNSVVSCSATAVDSTGNTVSGQASFLLQNSVPTITTMSINPQPLYLDSIAECLVSASDANGSVFLNYTWTWNGSIVGTNSTLNLADITPSIGDAIICSVTAVDEHAASISQQINTSSANRLPSAPTVIISPEAPIAGEDDLVCQVTSASTDLDGQALSFTYDWYINGVSMANTATLSSTLTNTGDIATCDVIAYDGFEYGPSGSDQVTVQSPCFWGECDYNLALLQTGVDFVEIQHGLFEMGSPTNEIGRYLREDLHYVYLSHSFYAMTTEVTQEMFQTLMGYNPSFFGNSPADTLYGGLSDCGLDCPVEYVTWHEAAAFANQLTTFANSTLGTTMQACYTCSGSGSNTTCTTNDDNSDFYECTGYRLPTEAEWEYMTKTTVAAPFNADQEYGWLPSGQDNGGVDFAESCTADVYLDSMTQSLDDIGWYCFENIGINGDSTYGTKPVAQKSPTDNGLYDVYGNVREWTQDAYQVSLGNTLNINPYPSTQSYQRVTKGGYWGDTPRNLRSSARFSNTQNVGLNGLGFRLVQSAP